MLQAFMQSDNICHPIMTEHLISDYPFSTLM